MSLGKTILLGLLLFAVLYLLLNLLLPRLLNLRRWTRNRDIPIILTAVTALGSAWAAHQAGISPAFGAFLAGMLLSESPFATQIRADITPLHTLLVTLFFAAIGMLVDPVWIGNNILYILPVPILVAVAKPTVIHLILTRLGYPACMSLATGICLFQVGEFSFVLAEIAESVGVIDLYLFRLLTSSIVLSLLISPLLIRVAPRLANRICRTGLLARPGEPRTVESEDTPAAATGPAEEPIVIIGFGPAGRQVAEALLATHSDRLLILDVNLSHAQRATELGLRFQVGDAGQMEVLEKANVHNAAAVIITLPDPSSARHIMALCRHLAPEVKLFVRSRHHIYRWEFIMDGAEAVVDEEVEVGRQLAEEVLKGLGERES